MKTENIFIEAETHITLVSKRGLNTHESRLSVKGKGSQRTKHIYQLRREKCDDVNSIKVQRAIDNANTICIAKAEIQGLKKASKNRRQMWAKKRKA